MWRNCCMPCFRTWSAYCFVSDHGKGEPRERSPMFDTQAAKIQRNKQWQQLGKDKKKSLFADRSFSQSCKYSLLYRTAKILSFDFVVKLKCRPTESRVMSLYSEQTSTVCLHFVPRRAGSHLQPISVYETGGAAGKSGKSEMKSSAFNSK